MWVEPSVVVEVSFSEVMLRDNAIRCGGTVAD
jgi:hypothetical protein